MDNKKMNFQDLREYVEKVAEKYLKEEKTENLGDPTKLKMNQKPETETGTNGSKVSVSEKGKFKIKNESPKNLPKDTEIIKDPIEIDMKERGEGSDGDWSTVASVKGTNSKKQGVKNHADGLSKPDVTSKKGNPKVSEDADPTKIGGVEGDKNNVTKMNKEDADDKQTVPKTQVIGKGEKSKEGYSKGQTDQEVNVEPKQEKDEYKEKLDSQIKTIQLPESFKNKKELLTFIKKEAKRISKTL